MRCNDLSANAPRFISEPGTNKLIDYKVKVEKDGSITLVENGYIDTQEMIESHRQGCELQTLIMRYEAGDLSALNQVNGFYADMQNAPKTLADSMQLVINAQNAFDVLPIDIKKEFGSDWRRWLASAGEDDWLKVMESVLPGQDTGKEEKVEVTSDEQK